MKNYLYKEGETFSNICIYDVTYLHVYLCISVCNFDKTVQNVIAIFILFLVSNHAIWISLTRLSNYNHWVTAPGMTASYFNWGQQEPSNINNCAAIVPTDGFKWKAKPCEKNAYFVCELKAWTYYSDMSCCYISNCIL